MNKKKIHRTSRDRAVADLLAMRDTAGYISGTAYALAAARSGYSERHLRRLVAALTGSASAVDKEETFVVDADVITGVFRRCGNVSGAYKDLKQAGRALPSLSTFQRRVRDGKDGMGSSMLQIAKKGPQAQREARVHLGREKTERGHTYYMDHSELPILAIPEGYRTASRPWLTVVMDAATRYVLGWTLTFGTPNAEQVRATLIAGIRDRLAPDDATTVGGIPDRVVWDRGLDFLSDLMTESTLRMNIVPVALPAYSPELKAPVERFFGTFKRGCLAVLPGYTDSGKDLRDELLLAGKALPELALVAEIKTWMDAYNASHVHSTLQMTPLQAWQADLTPLRFATDAQLWENFLISNKATVGKPGIRFKKHNYLDVEAKLNGYIGQKLEIRHLPHDRSFIEVFDNGTHVATCYQHDDLAPDDRAQFAKERRAAERRNTDAFRRANTERGKHPDAIEIAKTKTASGKQSYEVVEPVLDLRHDLDDLLLETASSTAAQPELPLL